MEKSIFKERTLPEEPWAYYSHNRLGGLLNNSPKLKLININNKYRRCRGRARVNQFNHFLYCTYIIAWTGLFVNPLSMITCEIEDNRHFAQIADIRIVQVADAVLSGKTLEFPHELLAVNLIGSRIPVIGNPIALIGVFMGLAVNLTGADFPNLFPHFLFLVVVDARMGERVADLRVNVQTAIQSAELPHLEEDFFDAQLAGIFIVGELDCVVIVPHIVKARDFQNEIPVLADNAVAGFTATQIQVVRTAELPQIIIANLLVNERAVEQVENFLLRHFSFPLSVSTL